MSDEAPYSSSEISRLGMAGMARNIGFGVNKVFSADLLSRLTPSQPLIGLILGMEGLLGIVLNPLTGWISDRYTTRWGRRRIYLLICLPMAGLLWIAFTSADTLDLAIVFLFSFYFFQQASPTPYQAWMPDIVAPINWGRASGLLNFWWQMGNFLAFLPIPLLWEKLHGGAFMITALLMIAGGAVTGLTVRESPHVRTARPSRPSMKPFLSANLIKYFVAQFLWWLAFEAMASFFTLFMVHTLHGTVIDSALGMALFTLSAILTSIQFGRIYKTRSPRRVLSICLAAFGILGWTGTLIHHVTPGFVILFVAGIFWGGIQVVSYPWGTDLLRDNLPVHADPLLYHGFLYGLANLAQALGLLVAAPLAGVVIAAQHGWYGAMFWISLVASAIALVVVLSVRDRSTPASLYARS